jgi:DNA mismatch repair protein MutL
MSVIHILSENVANKIAAGEVVERPASVVKELVENSVDAGAGRIEVTVEAGGKRLIRVVDDGCGMSHDDAMLAFERHATSKIRSAEDLFEISTLGFRGEALPSIAAVSRLVLETRHASENSGTRIEFAGGKLRDVKEVAWSGGTRIEVRDLLFNVPARRKFLKSESTELGHIATLVTHYALAHPEKSFRVSSLVNEILNVSPVASHRERIYQTMGGQLLAQLIEMKPQERRMPNPPAFESGMEEGPEAAEEPPLVRVAGFVSRPEVEKLNRNSIYFFVNRRLVRDRLILHAITEAYRNILAPSVFPVALIFLELPPAEVDVNVHPSKIEVRFRHSGFIHDFVRDFIRQALITARPVAAFPLPKRSMPAAAADDEAEIAEKLGEEPPLMRDAGLPSSRFERGHPEFGAHGAESGRLAGPKADPDDVAAGGFQLSSPRPQPHTGTLPLGEFGLTVCPAADPVPIGPDLAVSSSLDLSRDSQELLEGYTDAPPRLDRPVPSGTDMAGEFPLDLNPLGQVQESFIVATNPDGLWIIDQHVAHERVLFERHLRLCREKRIEGQRLLLPIVVELKPEQEAIFQDIAEELRTNGFEVEPFGQRTVAIKIAPADIAAEDAERLLIEILDGVGGEARAISLDELRGKIAASVACHAAIKANVRLERNKMQWLLRELGKTQCPMKCPHGRPIVLRYPMKDIQKAFRRI